MIPTGLAANFLTGSCVDISGDTAIVGAPGNEAVFVFVRNGGVWTQQQRIVKGGINSGFGMKCAISGDSIIIGSRNEPGNPAGGAGAAYIFARSGNVWSQQARLIGFAGTTGQIGDSVAIDGNTAVIGVSGSGSIESSAQVYVRSGTTWSEQQKITNVANVTVGGVVAINGDTLVTAARGVINASNGAAYVFVRSGGVWTPQQALVPSNTGTNPNFGSALAVNGNTEIIGAWSDASIAGSGAG